MRKINLSSS